MTEIKNPFGRPREWDLDEMAYKLIEWVKKPDSINLCGFCAENMLSPSYISRWAKENYSFCQAYEYVKAQLGDRREKMLNEESLHVKAYDLNAKTYDHFLKEEHRQDLEFQSQLAKAQELQGTDEQKNALKTVLDWVSSQQKK